MPPHNDTKPMTGDASATLRLRRAVPAQAGAGDLRKRLILALAGTVDAEYVPRSYPQLEPDKGGRSVSSDSRSPVLRMRGGASVTVREAVAAVATGTTPPMPVAPPAGRPMMIQKVESPSAAPAAPEGPTSPAPTSSASAAPVQNGAPLAVRRKLEVRAGALPNSAPSAPPVSGAALAPASRAPLIPLPIDAALGGQPPAFQLPIPVKPDAKSWPKPEVAKPSPTRKKNAPIGIGAVLVSVCLVCFLVVVFWMQRGEDEAQSSAGTTVSGNASPMVAESTAGVDAAPVPEATVSYAPPAVPPLEVAQLATVSSMVAWEMADAGWASANVAMDNPAPVPAEHAAPPAATVPAPAVKPVATTPKAQVPTPAPPDAVRRPEPSRAFQVFVESLKVSGVLQQTPVRAIIDGGTVFAGDVLEPGQGIRLVGADFEQRQLVFEDKTRAQVKIFY